MIYYNTHFGRVYANCSEREKLAGITSKVVLM